jgi:hypothetical protein
MAERPPVCFFWRVLDRLDYWLTQARLWLADAVYGPFPDGGRARLIGIGLSAAVAGRELRTPPDPFLTRRPF